MPRLKPSPAEQRRQTFRSIMRYNADRMGLTTDGGVNIQFCITVLYI